LSATSTTIPVSPYDYGQQQASPFPGNFPGSPYISEVTLTWRHTNGQLVSGTSTVNVSVAPTTIIAFSTLNTGTGDQFHTLLGSGPVNVTGGVGTIFIHSSNIPGTATLTVTATDPDNAQTISSQLQFTVAGAGTALPASISVASSGTAYVSNSGGPQSAIITATVNDGSNAHVADPSGYNNVRFEVLAPANSDARLSVGQAAPATAINTATHNGIASATFLSGSQQGPVQIRVTADRGDNNVDNGIQDPVSATTTVVVSDGKLFNLALTQPGPNANSILINGVSSDASSSSPLPINPDGTYSLLLSVHGVDRQGNAVLPGTQIRFGEIDGPLNGFTGSGRGQFAISGGDGNPQESGTLFTAPTGAFTTAGGGAGPGDAVLVFGKEVTGNRDLENARTVRSINNDASLNTTTAFNRNDIDTGTSVDYGPVLPYIVGRALDGSITASAVTNDVGVASVHLTYPVSKLGKLAAVWAQGDGTAMNGAARTVDDIALVRFAGVAAVGDLTAAVTASPNPIVGNAPQAQLVTVCISDALGSPLQGIQFTFQYTGSGTAKVDGTTGSGSLGSLTDTTGCAVASVTTSGVAPSTSQGGGGELKFCSGALCATVSVVVNIAVLQVSPSKVFVSSAGATVDITITALDTFGNKVPGAVITGTCSASGGNGATILPSSFTGTTDATGSVVDTVIASNFVKTGNPPVTGTGQCQFTSSGAASATVTFIGQASCVDFSPSTCK
jgi:hypothetical protein